MRSMAPLGAGQDAWSQADIEITNTATQYRTVKRFQCCLPDGYLTYAAIPI